MSYASKSAFRIASAIGRDLGNLNDRTVRGGNVRERGLRWRVVNRLSARLYVLGDRA